jgi:hypothetical protein
MIKYAAVVALAGFLGSGSLLVAKTKVVELKDAKGVSVGTATIARASTPRTSMPLPSAKDRLSPRPEGISTRT